MFLNKKYQKGFTVLELLIVIAIIALLTSVVLVALGSAKGKGNDAAVKENLANIRVQGALYYDLHGAYCLNRTGPGGSCDIGAINGAGGACSTQTTVFDDTAGVQYSMNPGIVQAAKSSTDSSGLHCTMDDYGKYWAVDMPVSTGRWCVDSSGNAKVGADTDFDGVCG